MKLEDVISRLNEEDIQDVVGQESLQLIQNLDSSLLHVGNLKKSLLKIYSPQEIILNNKFFSIIVDLLKIDEVKELGTKLNIKNSDDLYQEIKNLNTSSSIKKKIIFDFFEVPELPLPNKIESEPITLSEPLYSLFLHQRKAVEELKKLLYSRTRRALLHMPTGSGKTRTSINLICEHLRNKETVVIWFANTEELCLQVFEEIQMAWKYLGNRKLNIIKFWGSNSVELDKIEDGFIIAGLLKTYSQLKSDHNPLIKLSRRISLIIMDEAHMAIAPTYKQILEIFYFGGQNSSLLGLSATPGRTWNNPDEDRELSEFFSLNKVTLSIPGYDNPVDYLVDKGYLAKINNITIFNDSGFDVKESDLNYLKDNLQLPNSILKKLSENNVRNLLILNRIKELVKKHKRIIVFALNVEHANVIATVLQSIGINAFSITSHTPSDQRTNLIELYKSDSDENMILCNYGILTTGFDAPKTSCAVITRPTDSLVLYSQMVGRAIRGERAGGNKEADIVTVVDTFLPGFGNISEAFFNWEDVWN